MERGDPLVRWWVGWSATSPTTPWSAGCRCACPYTAPGRSPTAASSGHPRAVAERPCVQVGRPRHAHLLHPGWSLISRRRQKFLLGLRFCATSPQGRRSESTGWCSCSALPTARSAPGVRPGVAAEVQHPRLRRALQPRPAAGRRRLLQSIAKGSEETDGRRM